VKLLADECCPGRLVQALRDEGFDVVYVFEAARGATDAQVADMAIAESRIVLTADYDFGEMAVREKLAMPGVIIIAPWHEPIIERIARVRQVLTTPGIEFAGRLTIIGRERVRFRPLSAD
jgi:uncharacterized protein with PIN domain